MIRTCKFLPLLLLPLLIVACGGDGSSSFVYEPGYQEIATYSSSAEQPDISMMQTGTEYEIADGVQVIPGSTDTRIEIRKLLPTAPSEKPRKFVRLLAGSARMVEHR